MSQTNSSNSSYITLENGNHPDEDDDDQPLLTSPPVNHETAAESERGRHSPMYRGSPAEGFSSVFQPGTMTRTRLAQRRFTVHGGSPVKKRHHPSSSSAEAAPGSSSSVNASTYHLLTNQSTEPPRRNPPVPPLMISRALTCKPGGCFTSRQSMGRQSPPMATPKERYHSARLLNKAPQYQLTESDDCLSIIDSPRSNKNNSSDYLGHKTCDRGVQTPTIPSRRGGEEDLLSTSNSDTSCRKCVLDDLSCDCQLKQKPKSKQHFIEHIASHMESILVLCGADTASDLGEVAADSARAFWDITKGHRRGPKSRKTKRNEPLGVFGNHLAGEDPASPSTAASLSGEAPAHPLSGGLVAVKNVPFKSTCERHMMPYFGTVSLCYAPRLLLITQSRLQDLVEQMSQTLQEQEAFASAIMTAVMKLIKPAGMILKISATHTCAMTRGSDRNAAEYVTVCSEGLFRSDWSVYKVALAELRC